MPKVLIADHLSSRALEVFDRRGIMAVVENGLSPERLQAVIDGYDAVIVRSATRVSAEAIAASTTLRAIGRAGIGVDTIDVEAATQRGIAVMNTPFGNAITTAEHAIALMCALARQIPQADRSTREGGWNRGRFIGVELTGKTLGVIGCGAIGAIVAERALGLKMKVVGYDPFLSLDRAADMGIEKLDLEALFHRSDFITLHSPLNNDTRNLLDAAAFESMKPGVRLINCARAGLIVEADLHAALISGVVAGAALDVFETEPPTGSPLLDLPQVIVTPHLSAATREAQENVAIQIAQQIADYLLDGAVTNAVNMPSVTAEEAAHLAPYIRLAGQLGSFAGQIVADGLCHVVLEYSGDAAELNVKPITAAALAGLLARTQEGVNPVSALAIARERDIELSEIRHDRAVDYQTLLRLTVETDHSRYQISGTLIHGTKPRVVEVEEIALEAELGRHMLFVRNVDRPGFVGNLGRLLGDEGINIATFHLGRNAEGGDAIVLAEIDQDVTPQILDRIRALPHVVEVRSLSF